MASIVRSNLIFFINQLFLLMIRSSNLSHPHGKGVKHSFLRQAFDFFSGIFLLKGKGDGKYLLFSTNRPR